MSENQGEKPAAPETPDGPDAKKGLTAAIQILFASVPLPTVEPAPTTRWIERGRAKTDPSGIY